MYIKSNQSLSDTNTKIVDGSYQKVDFMIKEIVFSFFKSVKSTLNFVTNLQKNNCSN